MNMSQTLKALEQARIRFVFLDGSSKIMSGKPGKYATILTDDLPRLVKVAELKPTKEGSILYRSETLSMQFYILEKGKGYFPERFEQSMLANRSLANPSVPVPESTHLYYAKMYWKLFHEGLWGNEPEFRKLAEQNVTNFTGPAVPSPKVA